jgi:fermentation-respiration switch protein FrsA (DUF1100 family)
MLTATIVAAYVAAVAALYFLQRGMVFQPGGSLAPPSEAGLSSVEMINFATADGTSLLGWHARPQAGQPTILYFHGNAGNLSLRGERFEQIIGSGFGLLAVTYRGYPGSEGKPSEQALLADGVEVFDWLAARSGTIVILGESLGTGVAVHVAAERTARALVLEAPFTAAVDIAGATYPWVPVRLLMLDQFLSRERIGRVDEPVLIVHGAEDRVVPSEHGRKLFEAANEPKQLVVFDNAGHDDLWEKGLWPAVLGFLQRNGLAVSSSAASRLLPAGRTN